MWHSAGSLFACHFQSALPDFPGHRSSLKTSPGKKIAPGGFLDSVRGFFGGPWLEKNEGVRSLHLRGFEVPILRGLNWSVLRGLGFEWARPSDLHFAPWPSRCNLHHFPGAICTIFQEQFAPFSKSNLHHLQVQCARFWCWQLYFFVSRCSLHHFDADNYTISCFECFEVQFAPLWCW